MDTRPYVTVLFGSGASAPLGVPTMTSMVQQFKRAVRFDELRDLHAKRNREYRILSAILPFRSSVSLLGYSESNTKMRLEHETCVEEVNKQIRLIEEQLYPVYRNGYQLSYCLSEAESDCVDIELALSGLEEHYRQYIYWARILPLGTAHTPSWERPSDWRKLPIVDPPSNWMHLPILDPLLHHAAQEILNIRMGVIHFVFCRSGVRVSHECLQRVYEPIFSAFQGLSYDVFTTNYDTLLEQYFAGTDIKIERGIDVRGVFDPSRLWSNPHRPKVVKLHGSVDLFPSADGIRHNPHTEAPIIADGTKAEAFLMYPDHIESSTGEAFSLMLEQFKTSLNEARACLVIGHSLRDQRIRGLLSATGEQRDGFPVCIIDPDADIVVKRLPNKLRGSAIVINRRLENLGGAEISAVIRSILSRRNDAAEEGH